MKGFHIVVLLSSAVLLVSAAPALELCNEESKVVDTQLPMEFINENHGHGYKFRIEKVQGYKVEKVDGGCNIELQLNLLETVCHVVNPKHFEDCELRGEAARAVMANCTVKMSVRNTDAKVTKYECDTRQVKTDLDGPVLVPLNSTEGLRSVNEAVSKFNQNTTNQHYYILKEVGRFRLGSGKSYYAEFALVETHCPMGSKINPEACKPLCPDRAHHAFCKSSYVNATDLESLECEFYPPSNTTALGPGEQEPICRHYVGGHPPHVGAGRPPLGPRGGDGHPPRVGGGHGGPPPHAGDGHGGRHHDSDGRVGHQHDSDGHGGRHHDSDGRVGHQHDSDGHGGRHHDSDGRVGHQHDSDGHGGRHHDSDGRVGHQHDSDGHGGRHHDSNGHPDQERQHHRPPFGSKHKFHAWHRFHRCHGSDPALHPICPWPRTWHRPSPRGKD